MTWFKPQTGINCVACSNDQSIMSCYTLEGYGQSQSHCSKILSNFLMQKLQVQILIQNSRLRLIDASCEEKENDTKDIHM